MSKFSADLRALFDVPNIAHVATLLPDGAPHSVPVWVGIESRQIAFLTSPGSRKARNLQADPRVAIPITDRERPTAMGLVRGHVSERVEGERAWEIIDRISHTIASRTRSHLAQVHWPAVSAPRGSRRVPDCGRACLCSGIRVAMVSATLSPAGNSRRLKCPR